MTAKLNIQHIINPVIVGIITEAAVHFRSAVSFFIVKTAVEHGQWNRLNKSILAAVAHVQPLSVSSVLRLSNVS